MIDSTVRDMPWKWRLLKPSEGLDSMSANPTIILTQKQIIREKSMS